MQENHSKSIVVELGEKISPVKKRQMFPHPPIVVRAHRSTAADIHQYHSQGNVHGPGMIIDKIKDVCFMQIQGGRL